MTDSNTVTAIILCGGLGIRLRDRVNDRPKSLTEFNEIPFLSYQINWLVSNGVNSLILASGYMGEMIEDYAKNLYKEIKIQISQEKEPLGSGGAALKAIRNSEFKTPLFLILNGDTFYDFKISELVKFHLQHRKLISMAIARVPDVSRFGAVDVESIYIKKITNKYEGPGFVNLGALILDADLPFEDRRKNVSLEKDIINKFTSLNQVVAYVIDKQESFYDFGTVSAYDEYVAKIKLST
jgi:D-glycero-alpha-D-manno-heptose 1-phosphate guanylyltransferase